MKNRYVLFFSLLISILFLHSVYAQMTDIELVMKKKVQGQETNGIVAVGDIALYSQMELPRFYSNRGYELAWTNRKNKKDLMESIAASYDEGLSPADYHQQRINALLEKSDNERLTNEELADLDLLMTDAILLYASHLMEGKLEQSELRKEWDVERNALPANPDSLLTTTLHNRDIKGMLEAIKPDHYMYKLMKFQLKKLRKEADNGGWPLVSEGEILKPGDTSARLVDLRKYLIAVGDLQDNSVRNEEIFDTEVAAAVKKFQWRHNLTNDGVIGKETIEQMRVPIEDRINMLILNLERVRWVFHRPDDDFLLVNIARFYVKRIKNSEEVFHSRVIVGRYLKESPIFMGVMEYIVMNPTWILPYSIATHETLPALKKDPGYLEAEHMEVMDRNGTLLNPDDINWDQYSAGNFPLIIRQKAGPWNALGEVKFIFPNKYMVYLHDTPTRGLFNHQDRAFSHGCIRTEDKWGLLMSLMDDPDVWNMNKINEILASGEVTTIDLPEPINIYLIYLTAEVDQSNNLMFTKDVYKRDAAVLHAMQQPFHYKSIE